MLVLKVLRWQLLSAKTQENPHNRRLKGGGGKISCRAGTLIAQLWVLLTPRETRNVSVERLMGRRLATPFKLLYPILILPSIQTAK